jgi:hypothetical protein
MPRWAIGNGAWRRGWPAVYISKPIRVKELFAAIEGLPLDLNPAGALVE